MSSAVKAYVEAFREFETAKGKAESLATSLRQAAEALGQLDLVWVADLGGSPRWATKDSPRIRAEGWPTAQKIAEAIEAYHAAKDAVQTAWMSVAFEDRAALCRPDGAGLD